ncbi:MAG: hypothetical protein GY851_18365 [bacterium]|nr:hypothetical protein [bacterium]
MKKRSLTESSAADDLAYWLSRPPEERVAAVEFLRRQHYGTLPRLQRTVRVIKLSEDR